MLFFLAHEKNRPVPWLRFLQPRFACCGKTPWIPAFARMTDKIRNPTLYRREAKFPPSAHEKPRPEGRGFKIIKQ